MVRFPPLLASTLASGAFELVAGVMTFCVSQPTAPISPTMPTTANSQRFKVVSSKFKDAAVCGPLRAYLGPRTAAALKV